MKSNAIILITIPILLFSTTRAVGQDKNSLAATVSVHKTELQMGEPLYVRLVITNLGTNAVVLRSAAPEIGDIFISSDGKEFYRNVGQLYPRMRSRGSLLLPSQSATSHLTVLWSIWYVRGNPPERVKPEGWVPPDATQVSDFAFPKPGTYFIQGGYENTTGTRVRSASVAVTVREPAGDDLAVWTQLKALPAYAGSIQSGVASPEAVEGFARIVQEHTNSVYSPYLALSLARYYQSRRDNPKVLEYAQFATQTSQNAWIREEGFFLCLRAADAASAKVLARKALADYPDGRYREKFQWIVNRPIGETDPFMAVQAELKGMGYDLDLITKDDDLFSKWFEAAIASTDTDFKNKQITASQMSAERAKRTKAFVLEHLKPTLTNAPSATTNSAPNSSP